MTDQEKAQIVEQLELHERIVRAWNERLDEMYKKAKSKRKDNEQESSTEI